MDAREEIDGILERRPPDHETLWPRDMDTIYGNPVEHCEHCGHERQVHGAPDGEFGTGECYTLHGDPTGPPTPLAETFAELLPACLRNAMMIRPGLTRCTCKGFKSSVSK